ncbi:MAG: hypothetical protein FJX71_04950 [Alphaproteobacteria bacterium]|nr:hypothetical protein [Alphaproteobacteria bacterium]
MLIAKKVDSFDPLNVAAQIADDSSWSWERLHPDELVIDVPGSWGEYRFHLCWQPESSIFYLACFLDLKFPDPLPTGIYELLGLINRRLWMGHFDLIEDQWIVFRYALPLVERRIKNIVPQIEELIDTIIGECETFYPVFGALLSHGIQPQDALQIGLVDTIGEA